MELLTNPFISTGVPSMLLFGIMLEADIFFEAVFKRDEKTYSLPLSVAQQPQKIDAGQHIICQRFLRQN